MSTSINFLNREPDVFRREGWTAPAVKPLDEAVWRAWLAKGRSQDARSYAARAKAVKCVSVATLLIAAAIGVQLPSYELLARCVVAAGAMVGMFQAFHAKHYLLAAIFASLTVVFNPVAPAFSFSGYWERAFTAASVLPFAASLVWSNSTGTKANA
jgi:hypothetical protein